MDEESIASFNRVAANFVAISDASAATGDGKVGLIVVVAAVAAVVVAVAPAAIAVVTSSASAPSSTIG